MSRELLSPLRGYSIPCAAPGCRQETADQATSREWRTAEAAVRAAVALAWVYAPLGPAGEQVWFCPLHQAWDPAALRWVAAPQGRA